MADNSARLEAAGYTMGTAFYANSMITLVIVGIQCFLVLYSFSAFLGTPSASRSGRIPYIVLSFLIFVAFSMSACIDCYYMLYLLSHSSNWEGWLRLLIGRNPIRWLRKFSVWLIYTWVTLGDGLMLYRCYIVWYERRWVVLLPGLTYLASVGTAIGFGIIATNETTNDGKLDTANVLLSVATNVIVTTLILFRLIRARRVFGQTLSHEVMKPYKGVIMMLVVESALPLAVFGLVHAGILLRAVYSTKLDPVLNAVSYFSALFFYAFNALSPQLITFQVSTGKSWMKPVETTQVYFTQSLAFLHEEGRTETHDDNDNHVSQHMKDNSTQYDKNTNV